MNNRLKLILQVTGCVALATVSWIFTSILGNRYASGESNDLIIPWILGMAGCVALFGAALLIAFRKKNNP